ncbi:MAG: T9SS type A sorting domain-containing protein [Bacteroidales bacterium]|nr:T9SS type A sorting domain-containing protein [Bacteroidales bacterium]
MKKILLTLTIACICVQSGFSQDYHWPLKTDLKEVKANKDGTNNGVTFINDPVRGEVAYFDGNSYANLPGFIKGNSEMTFAVWFRMDEVRPWSRIYSFGHGDQTEPKDVMMVIPVNGAGDPTKNWFRFTLSNPEGVWLDADVDTALAKIEVGKWYYSVIVKTADSVIGFLNDKVIIEEEYPRDLSTLDDTQNALGKSFWPDPLWKGAISDLRVYKKALTRAEVVALYNQTLPSAVPNLAKKQLTLSSKNGRILIYDSKLINSKVEVFNVAGSLLKVTTVDKLANVEFEKGLYIVRITSANETFTGKVVVK